MNENNQQQHPVTPTHSWGVIAEVEGGFNGEPAQQHSDDVAVDRFAEAMKAKMAKQRVKGYGGWDDPAACPTDRLQQMLVAHISKGDPLDVANFAMMLWNRGERTEQPAQWPVAWLDPEGEDDCNVITAAWKRKLQAMSTRLEQEHAAKHTVPVYTSPPASKPLADKVILDMAEDCTAQYHDLLAFARAIEAAHGITEGGEA